MLIPESSVNPFTCLVETVLPLLEEDSKDMISRILLVSDSKGIEIAIQDGFDLYKDLVEVRRLHAETLPK